MSHANLEVVSVLALVPVLAFGRSPELQSARVNVEAAQLGGEGGGDQLVVLKKKKKVILEKIGQFTTPQHFIIKLCVRFLRSEI